jgi:transposase
MKPYSVDLREKILTAYLKKEGTIRQLAPRFNVSPRFVGELIARFRRTGSYAPKPHGGGNPPCIPPSHHETIADLVQHYPDAPLKELCRYVEEKCHVTPSKSSLQRTFNVLQLTRKKRPSLQQNATQMTYKDNAKSIKRT